MGSDQSKLKLKVQHHTIILHHAFKMTLQIDNVQQFPHGFDGLKLWEAGIVLARYCILQNSIFKNKNVLQLGSGVGIGGMSCFRWTQCKSVTMSDYQPVIIETIKRNLIKNNCKNILTQILDWNNIDKMEGDKYDVIMGSDIVYFGCPVKALYQVFKKLLRVGGVGVIVIPNRQNYAELFVKEIEQGVFEVEKKNLVEEEYKMSPLEDQERGRKQYSLLHQIDFYVYKITKKLQ